MYKLLFIYPLIILLLNMWRHLLLYIDMLNVIRGVFLLDSNEAINVVL